MFAAAGSPFAQAPRVADVLARTAAYTARFEREFPAIVAEEYYFQDFHRRDVRIQRRELKSDMLFIRNENDSYYLQFRDVLEVDGRTVRKKGQRLAELFSRPSTGMFDRARQIADESARYNIGSAARTINIPVLALAFLTSANQYRSRFSVAEPDAASNEWPKWTSRPRGRQLSLLRFEETDRETMIRDFGGGDLPSHGRFWIDAQTGQVFVSELVTDVTGIHAVIQVRYGNGPIAGVLVPVEMRETYDRPFLNERTEGIAQYSHFERFSVGVTTTVK